MAAATLVNTTTTMTASPLTANLDPSPGPNDNNISLATSSFNGTNTTDWTAHRHRDKAQILLQLAQAVEDSHQRRRKLEAKPSAGSTLHDLKQLALEVDQETKALGINKQNVTSTNANGINIPQTIQSVVSGIQQLREHSQLQYQLLEMKYFDAKRHAFALEDQHRKLQLQMNGNTNGKKPVSPSHNNNIDNNNTMDNDNDNSSLITQLQQENHKLRLQLRESCHDCRQLVQENYGLRQLLMDAGINLHLARSQLHHHHQAGEMKDDDSSSDNFEDAHEYAAVVPAVIPEERPVQDFGESNHGTTHTQSTMQSTVDDSDAISVTSTSSQRSRKSATFAAMAHRLAQDKQHRESRSSSGMSLASSMTSLEYDSYTYSAPIKTTTTTTKEQAQHAKNLELLGVSGIYAASAAVTTSTDDTNATHASGETSATPQRKNYASYLRHSGSSSATTTGSHSTTPLPPQDHIQRQQLQQQHKAQIQQRRFSHTRQSSSSSLSVSSAKSQRSSSRGRSKDKQSSGLPRIPRQSSSSSILSVASMPATTSSTGRSRRHSSKPRTVQVKPTRHALSAKDLMKQQAPHRRLSLPGGSNKAKTFHIQMTTKTPPSTTLTVTQEEVDPVEEEQRLSELMGGFRSGKRHPDHVSPRESGGGSPGRKEAPSKAKVSHSGHPSDDVSVASHASKGSKSRFFRRPSRKSFSMISTSASNSRAHDDDDNVSVGSTRSLGFFFRKQKSRRKSVKRGSDDRSVGSHVG